MKVSNGRLSGWLCDCVGGLYPLLTKTPIECFIKANVSRGNDLLGSWIPNKVAIGVVGIPYEYTFEGCVCHFATVIRWYMDAGWATKNTEVLKVWSVARGQGDWNAFNASVV